MQTGGETEPLKGAAAAATTRPSKRGRRRRAVGAAVGICCAIVLAIAGTRRRRAGGAAATELLGVRAHNDLRGWAYVDPATISDREPDGSVKNGKSLPPECSVDDDCTGFSWPGPHHCETLHCVAGTREPGFFFSAEWPRPPDSQWHNIYKVLGVPPAMEVIREPRGPCAWHPPKDSCSAVVIPVDECPADQDYQTMLPCDYTDLLQMGDACLGCDGRCDTNPFLGGAEISAPGRRVVVAKKVIRAIRLDSDPTRYVSTVIRLDTSRR